MTEVLITRLPHGEGLALPSLATPGAAGYDIASADAVSYTHLTLPTN